MNGRASIDAGSVVGVGVDAGVVIVGVGVEDRFGVGTLLGKALEGSTGGIINQVIRVGVNAADTSHVYAGVDVGANVHAGAYTPVGVGAS